VNTKYRILRSVPFTFKLTAAEKKELLAKYGDRNISKMIRDFLLAEPKIENPKTI
jgi:bisphosphoglycerate-dependent phosphoglycerate mutase